MNDGTRIDGRFLWLALVVQDHVNTSVLYLLLFRMYCDLFCLLWCSPLLRGTCHLGVAVTSPEIVDYSLSLVTIPETGFKSAPCISTMNRATQTSHLP